MFEAAGFAMIATETMTFAEQVRRFAAAGAVVAPHGAGLANVLWSAPGATVVEIFSPAYATQRCIWGLATACGHRYAAAVAANAASKGRQIRWSQSLVREILDWSLAGS
jgi:capsular polysaccharide biosynthesis protein